MRRGIEERRGAWDEEDRVIEERRGAWDEEDRVIEERRGAWDEEDREVGRRKIFDEAECKWENNIKMDLREVGYDDRDWINFAQDRDRWRAYVRAAMNLRPLKDPDHQPAAGLTFTCRNRGGRSSNQNGEHITNANHTYRDINTDMEILHIQPKSQNLNTLEQYEIYRHTKTLPNDILNTQLNFKTHTLFDSTLRTHPHRKQEAPRPTTTSSEDD
ncbi:hypothetical protein ANN_11694 [Periplaneta americana]|uniref:Uncharacterized protein n=1 Tax=Periplaneta americana TaxID=6978 RepID=A0ABQ8T5S1_PERAM|nr:hypothetical protein ANN_11694 [Periplaneta americana]